jgi:hypothetical protein
LATSCPETFKASTIDEEEILKLVEDHLVSILVVLQWWPTKGEDIPTSNTQEIMVLKAFFQRGFGIPSYDLFHNLLD